MSAKMLTFMMFALLAVMVSAADYYIGDTMAVSESVLGTVTSGLQVQIGSDSTTHTIPSGMLDRATDPVVIESASNNLEAFYNNNDNGGSTLVVVPEGVLIEGAKLHTYMWDIPDNRECYQQVSISPEISYVTPGSVIEFRTNVVGAEWHVEYGKLYVRGTKVFYTAPTVLNASRLVDTVTVVKGKCKATATVNVEADNGVKLEITAPQSLKVGSSASVYALLKDEYGNPVSGKKVRFTLASANGVPAASLKAGNDEGLVVDAITWDNGKAYVTLSAGNKSANYTLKAQHNRANSIMKISVVIEDDGVNPDAGNTDNDSNSNSNGNDNNSNNNGGGSYSGGGGENTGHLGSGGVSVVGVTREEESVENKTKPAEVEPVSEKPAEQPVAVGTATAEEVRVTYYKRVYLGEDIVLTLKYSNGEPVVGRRVTISSQDGSAEVESDQQGVARYTPKSIGDYRIRIEGSTNELTVKVVEKPTAHVEEQKPKEATFDIVAALTGGNTSSLPLIAVLLVVLVLVVGAAVYFLNQKEEM